MFGANDPSDLQRQIIRVHDQNPDMKPTHIADRCDCSTSYVRETIKEYRGDFGGGFGGGLGGSGGFL